MELDSKVMIYAIIYVNGIILTNGLNDGTMQCKAAIDQRLKVFEVLPGMGWDNLQNVEMGQVAYFTYNKCQITNDRNFLIPDQVNVQPIKETNIDKFAMVMETMQDYSSMTSKTINSGSSLHLPFVSASFSSEYRKTKMHKMEQRGQTSTFRVQARYLRYRSILQQGMYFYPDFKKRLLKISEQILVGNSKMADYMSQLVIRDYGTHIITSCDAGGLLAKEDEISFTSEADREIETQTLKTSTALRFHALFGLIKAGAEHDQTSTSSSDNEHKYLDKVQNSVVKTIGGPNYRFPNAPVSDWIANLDNNLVALDRKGEPLYNLITESNLQELPDTIIPKLQRVIQRAFDVYHKRNTYYGCTDMTSDNFDARANVDDKTCHPSETKSTFGGTYQVCNMLQTDNGDLCDSKLTNNHLTGQATCPEGFQEINIYVNTHKTVRNEKKCKKFLWHKYKCHQIQHVSSAIITAYWCGLKSGSAETPYYRFGGVYSANDRVNPLTNAYSCPREYIPTTIADGVTFCVTSDVTLPDIGATFGGMFSCRFGNSMAGGNKNCPAGFSQHLVSSVTDCDVIVCLQYESLFGINQTLPALQRPPFTKMPPVSKPHEANAVVIDTDNHWFKDEKAYSKITELAQSEKHDKKMANITKAVLHVNRLVNMTETYFSVTPSTQNDSSTLVGKDKLSRTSVVLVSSGTTTVCMFGAYLAFFFAKRKM